MRRRDFALLLFLCVLMFGITACSKPYSATGKVTDLDGQGVSGVTLCYSGGTNGSTTTDAAGNWTVANLKKTVTITPQKAGWVFNPKELMVTEEITGVIFRGTDDPEALLKDMIVGYSQAFNQKDTDTVVNFFHQDYLTNQAMTRTELAEYYEQRYGSNEQIGDLVFEEIEIDGNNAEVLMLVKIIVGSIESEYVWELNLTLVNLEWKITDFEETQYEVYVRKPAIVAMLAEFMEAFAEEDIQTISDLTSEAYSYVEMNKEDFLEYIVNLFERIEIFEYETEVKYLYYSFDYSAQVILSAKMKTDGINQDRALDFLFVVVEEGGNWLVQSLTIKAQDSIELLNQVIDVASGDTGFIQIDVTVESYYSIETSFYQEDCDTELFLYNSNYVLIDRNQDIGGTLYSKIHRKLSVGTYYVKITEVSQKHLYCILKLFREGL